MLWWYKWLPVSASWWWNSLPLHRTCYLLFRTPSSFHEIWWSNFGETQRKALYGAHHRICLPDPQSSLISLWIWFTATASPWLNRQKDSETTSPNWAQKKIKRRGPPYVVRAFSCSVYSFVFQMTSERSLKGCRQLHSKSVQNKYADSIICQSSREAENCTLLQLKW